MTLAAISLALIQKPTTPNQLWVVGGVLMIAVIVGIAALFSMALRRSLVAGSAKSGTDISLPAPSTDNPTAFITASMQAVIQKLRDQEKELAALHKRDRERAQQTERLSEAVTRNMPAGLLLISSAGLITSANPAAEAALGVRALPYRRYTEVLGNDSRMTKLVASCLSDACTYRREEIEYATPSGELRELGVTISPILGPGTKVTGALCLLSDLTELAALHRQVRMKESLAALGELSAGIAHEFKNALATISGYAQMIRSETEGDAKENAQRILEQTRSLAHVVTEFLKFARPLDLADEDVDMDSLIRRVVVEVNEVISDVEISIVGHFETLSGDETLLRQAFLNLVRNAAEAASGQAFGGKVTIRCSSEHAGGLSIQRISICDNGPGVSESDLGKIFVPFYTTKSQGTGLGLAIVQKIAVQHGGGVEVRNQTEGGAEFILWLPVSRRVSPVVDSLALDT